MAKMIFVTQAAGSVSDTSDDIKVLVNADMILKIDDTDENYAGDSRIVMLEGTPLYVTESLQELSLLINS